MFSALYGTHTAFAVDCHWDCVFSHELHSL